MRIYVSWLLTSLLVAVIPFSIWLITYFARRGELELAFLVMFVGYISFVVGLYRFVHSIPPWYFRIVLAIYPLLAIIWMLLSLMDPVSEG